MDLPSLVATPGLGVVEAQFLSLTGDIPLGEVGVRGLQRDALVGARRNGRAHRRHEGRTAIRIDGMVAAMVRHHHMLQPIGLRQPRHDGEHDTIAERHDGRFHVLLVVITLRDGLRTLQQGATEILLHEGERNGDMLDAQFLAMVTRERDLLVVMVAAVMEGNRQGDIILVVVEHGRAVHATR